MPYNTFTRKQKALIALSCMQFAVDVYQSDLNDVSTTDNKTSAISFVSDFTSFAETSSLRKACEIARRGFIQKSTLSNIINGNKSLEISRNSRGSFINIRENECQKAFTTEEETKLVDKIIMEMDEGKSIRTSRITSIATDLRDDVPFALICNRKRLINATFTRKWFRSFVGRHKDNFCMKKRILIEGKQDVAFSANNISSFL